MCNDKALIDTSKSVTYVEGWRLAVAFYLEVRGGNIIMRVHKITKFCICWYCTGYYSILYGQPGTCLFGSYNKTAVKYFEVLDYAIEFGLVGVIPDFYLSQLSSLRDIRWLAVENDLYPVTASISSLPTHRKLRYFFLGVVTGYFRPRMYLLTCIILEITTMGGRYLDFRKKIQGKKVSWRSFSTPENVYPVSSITHCKNEKI